MAGSWRSSLTGDPGWFHVHTRHTHGESTVAEYLATARALGVGQVAFLEHVRAAPTYDVDAFAREVAREAATHGVTAYAGFEAKILRGGLLDIDPGLLATADVIGIAEHRYDGTAESLVADFDRLVADLTTAHPAQAFVWVHPGSWLLQRSNDPAAPAAYARMVRTALEHRVLIERNLKYGIAPAEECERLGAERTVVGLDAHSVGEAVARWEAR